MIARITSRLITLPLITFVTFDVQGDDANAGPCSSKGAGIQYQAVRQLPLRNFHRESLFLACSQESTSCRTRQIVAASCRRPLDRA